MADNLKARLEELYNITEERIRELTTAQAASPRTTPEIPSSASETNERVCIIILLCVFSVIGTLGNGLVLYVFARTTGKLTSTIFILALAGTDFVTCLIIIPFTVITIHYNYYYAFDSLCKIYQFLITCNVPLSAFIMVAIAADRYICICHPFAHMMTVKRAKVIVGVLTGFAVILGLITALGFSIYRIEIVENKLNVSSITSPISQKQVFVTVNKTTDDWLDVNRDTVDTYTIDGESETIRYTVQQCQQSAVLYSHSFITVYQKIYSAFYLCSLLIVLILYSLIYSSVTRQRAKRRAQKTAGRVKQVNTQCQTDESTMPLTSMVEKNAKSNGHNRDIKVEMEGETVCTKLSINQENGNGPSESQPIKSPSVRRHTNSEGHRDRRDRDRLANIKTAIMLFIVTIVFIIAFLPSWLMAHQWLEFNTVVFYMYFAYNVANPVIYAFMNQMFRENMCRIFSSCRMYFNSGGR